MADNFTKAKAFALIEGNTGTNKLKLGDIQLSDIHQWLKAESFTKAYSTGLEVKAISEGSVTYQWNSDDVAFGAKTGIGAGTITAGTGLKQKTVYFADPVTRKAGFTKVDLMSGLQEAAAVKYAWSFNALEFRQNKEFFKALAGSVAAAGTTVIAAPAATNYTLDELVAIKNQLVNAAIKLTTVEDHANGVMHGFSRESIFIDLDPTLFNLLSDSRLMQDQGKQVFQNGQFTIGQMGGFTVRANTFLGTAGTVTSDSKVVPAIVTTNNSAISQLQVIAANAGDLGDLSDDTGYYIEARFTGDATGAEIFYDTILPTTTTMKIFSHA